MTVTGNPNDPLAAIEDLGYMDGVTTTMLKGGKVEASAGTLTAKGDDLHDALTQLLALLTATPKKDRPTSAEASTRRVALPEDDQGEREIVHPDYLGEV
jgi:hypothetical protein